MFFNRPQVVIRLPRRRLTPRPIPDTELNSVISDEALTALQQRTAERAARARVSMGARWCCSPVNSPERTR